MHPQAFHRLAPVISAVEREAAGWFGAPVDTVTPEQHVERASSDLLMLRVRTRTLTVGVALRVWRVSGERPQERRQVEERVRREYRATRDRWQAFQGNELAGCVRPLAYFPDHLAIATEVAAGQPLASLLERVLLPFASRSDRLLLDRACRGAGEWLRQYQRSEERGLCDKTELREYIEGRLRRLVANPMAGFTEADRVHVLFVTAWLLGQLQGEELVEVPVHGDFSPEKLMIGDSQLVLMNAESARRGLEFHDVANLYMRLGLYACDRRYSAALIRDVQRKFLRAFEPLDPQHPRFSLALLVNVLNHYVALGAQRHASVTTINDWTAMRRHRSWLRRLDPVRPSATAGGAIRS